MVYYNDLLMMFVDQQVRNSEIYQEVWKCDLCMLKYGWNDNFMVY